MFVCNKVLPIHFSNIHRGDSQLGTWFGCWCFVTRAAELPSASIRVDSAPAGKALALSALACSFTARAQLQMRVEYLSAGLPLSFTAHLSVADYDYWCVLLTCWRFETSFVWHKAEQCQPHRLEQRSSVWSYRAGQHKSVSPAHHSIGWSSPLPIDISSATVFPGAERRRGPGL